LSKEDLRAGEDRKLIPEGKYTAQCVEAKRSMVGVETTKGTFARTPKVVLRFFITEGKYQGEEIPMFLNVNYKRIPFGSKFYQCWVIANDCNKPNRREKGRMSLEIFKDHIFTVGVKTVKPRFRDGTEKPEPFWYSRVDEIYEKQA
jgi:hypothetical protein